MDRRNFIKSAVAAMGAWAGVRWIPVGSIGYWSTMSRGAYPTNWSEVPVHVKTEYYRFSLFPAGRESDG